MIRLHPLVVALSLALPVVPLCAIAAEADAGAAAARDVHDFDRLQVTATRTQRALVEVPGTVDVIDREQLDNQLVRELKDLFRYTPGVSVTSTSGRFTGASGVRIRGLDGNRVAILVDNVPVSDTFNFGSYLNANRNFVDLETLKRVEVVRGPASSLYGSDALGGVVAFVTKDPSDYLSADKHSYVGLKFGYEGDWNGLFAGATGAFGGERWSGMVAVSHRQGQEAQNQGDNRARNYTRTAPNPQQVDGRSVLGKLVYAPNAQQRFKLTVEGNEDDGRIEALSGIDARSPSASQRILSQDGRDHQTRARVSLRYELDALDTALADDLFWQLYRQDSASLQRTDELRGNNTRRHNEHHLDQRVYGLLVNAHKAIDTGTLRHDITYGLEGSWTDTREKRDGYSLNLANGAVSKLVGQDLFPVRDFPMSETTKLGVYAQDEMRLLDGRLSLIPGVRVDYFRLSPRVDDIFRQDNPGVAAETIDEQQVSPKFGAVWRFSDAWSAYANYAHGFRAPPYNDVNIGFTNLQARYTAIANPDLKSETSRGGELGLRFNDAVGYLGVSVYYTDYRNFIESYAPAGVNVEGLLLFQSRNVDDVVIKGAEARAGVDLGALAGWQGWSVNSAVAYSQGDNLTDDTPLNSVDPLRGTLGVAFDSERWGAEVIGTFVARKRRPQLASYYTPAGYATLDLMGHWEFAPGAKVTTGIFNLADRRYVDWNALPNGTLDSSTVLDRFTGAGRTASVSLAVSW
ncbi:TonB-dependent hemoglobin/transferrin/lactoferrin family receptor [Xanthomonas campestris pv. campestris]|uniref:TonB-dependent hemoglobin/transferrin/lactoferrin family receptor n=1 Tax=Xanthomonas campestris TaxID=339 RepID=UPI0023795675|nr:TonB-dependent hemoglobin/transferrin/lactoferrin family receptor [Xanthomonas campestris]WDK57463.1 TonB-dependent hemoglobin/transferrin/lactoferrin family receptor [Xanthomonas campestris pv. campestris]WDK63628.1 TonB-dependent hemoglobin/transferrin/lactoferrin family receptor [Xanthomonas campestris pv. campestris]WDK67673.1 TonB-dependent hemoglobin/transferrin/lactoferrin family receptor [Xanthomonas campestris pv. campestris]WDK71549.1 TonB-dependent hemoglobin/transferrin/lactoferr